MLRMRNMGRMRYIGLICLGVGIGIGLIFISFFLLHVYMYVCMYVRM